MTVTNLDADEFRYVQATDELARPLLAELEYEYDTRYGDFFGERASTELNRYPAEAFAPAGGGAFVLLLRQGEPIAGGAFKRYDETTAELKRIWTSSAHRRQGLARRIVAELESEALRQGYSRVYLTTGPRQPEAKALYLAAGYRPLYDTALEPEEVGIHAFEKTVGVER
ncbi:GNAT family N-acetyltransferase [Leifsonia xyli]|uniref:GNAT family N-acetyltransferase n=1 Tax=Leifsonia xyli TaxID=1575 RepID=UPI003D67976C